MSSARLAAPLYTGRCGAWRSLVARGLWVAEVPGSNPGAPIFPVPLGREIRARLTAGAVFPGVEGWVLNFA
jgi:hypothetical protein